MVVLVEMLAWLQANRCLERATTNAGSRGKVFNMVDDKHQQKASGAAKHNVQALLREK